MTAPLTIFPEEMPRKTFSELAVASLVKVVVPVVAHAVVATFWKPASAMPVETGLIPSGSWLAKYAFLSAF